MVHKFGKANKEVSGRGIHETDVKFKKAIEQTKIAYADSIGYPKGAGFGDERYKKWWEEVSKKRILDWKGTDYLPVDQWFEVAKVVGKYNEFDPIVVSMVLRKLGSKQKPLFVRMAREGSVAIYIKYGENNPKKIEKMMREFAKADEVHIDYDQYLKKEKDRIVTLIKPKKGIMRVWWD